MIKRIILLALVLALAAPVQASFQADAFQPGAFYDHSRYVVLMIYDRDNTHIDPVKDQRGCYKKGYVVEVFDETKPLVIPPAPPFVFLKVTGVTKEWADKYFQPDVDITNPDAPVMVRRRLFRLLWENLPTAVQDAFRDNRYYETSFAAIRAYIRNLKTGLTE